MTRNTINDIAATKVAMKMLEPFITALYVVRAPYNYPSLFKDEIYSDLAVALEVATAYAFDQFGDNGNEPWEFQVICMNTEQYDWENGYYHDLRGIGENPAKTRKETVGGLINE